MSRAKAHHYVPRSYLRQWAVDDRVVVRRRASINPFVASVSKVLQETDLYTIDTEGAPSDEIERLLAEYDGLWPAALHDLTSDVIPNVKSDARMVVSTLLALQYVRTPDRALFGRFPDDAFAAGGGVWPVPDRSIVEVFERHVGRPPSPPEVSGTRDFVNFALREDQRLERTEMLAAQMAGLPHVAAMLRTLSWSLERSPGLPYLTSDKPVHLWAASPPTFGGVGLAGADEIRFPVGPAQLLVMRKHGQEAVRPVSRNRVESVNDHVIATSWRCVVATPSAVNYVRRKAIRSARPVLVFTSGEAVFPGGERGEVLHSYTPYDDGSAAALRARRQR